MVYQTKSILQKLCVCCQSNKESEQTRALTALLSLLSQNKVHVDPSKKGKVKTLADLNEDGRHAELILVYLHNPKLVSSVIDLNDEVYLQNAMAFIFDSLFLPFAEVELLFLGILRSNLLLTQDVLTLEKVLSAFCRSSRSLEYLHMKPTKTKELFDAKNEFKGFLIHQLTYLKETVKDSFYELYLKEYRIKEETRKQELLQYASDTA